MTSLPQNFLWKISKRSHIHESTWNDSLENSVLQVKILQIEISWNITNSWLQISFTCRNIKGKEIATSYQKESPIGFLAKGRSSHQRCSVRKGIYRKFAKFRGKHFCRSLFFNKVAGGACKFIKKETLPQVFSCELCENF